jgi:hypothetical protein
MYSGGWGVKFMKHLRVGGGGASYKNLGTSALALVPTPALKPTQLPIQWAPGILSPWVKCGRGLTLSTHSHLVPSSRMNRNYPSSPPWSLLGGSVTGLF